MATGRVTRIRVLTPVAQTGRITKVRTVIQNSNTGRITRVRTSAGTGGTATTQTVEPFTTVNLGAGTWTQTSGPTVTPPSFTAPALPGGTVLTFTSTGTQVTITVLPHTYFALGISGTISPLQRNN
jgi:hypothetical protein